MGLYDAIKVSFIDFLETVEFSGFPKLMIECLDK